MQIKEASASSASSAAISEYVAEQRRLVVRAYCPCRRCCGHWADVPMSKRTVPSGAKLYELIRDGVGFVAAPKSTPLGTVICVPGYHGGAPVPVLDRTGSDADGQIEVFIPDHDAALVWGRQNLEIKIMGQWPAASGRSENSGLRPLASGP